MYYELRENKTHGTKDFPFVDYHAHDIPHAFQIPVHWHDEIEILYAINDPLFVSINGVEYLASPGDIFIVNPGELHFMGTNGLGTNYHTFVFPLEFISFQTDDALENKFFRPFRTGKYKFVNKLPQVTPEMRTIMEEVATLFTEKESFHRQLQVKIKLLTFFSMLTNDSLIDDAADDKGTLGRDILSIIQQNYTSDLRLEYLAEELHMSEKYLSRYFKQSFHITISQYISHLRITRAKHLLTSGNMPITEVAMQSGYTDVSYFIRAFHKATGVSPLKYRHANT